MISAFVFGSVWKLFSCANNWSLGSFCTFGIENGGQNIELSLLFLWNVLVEAL